MATNVEPSVHLDPHVENLESLRGLGKPDVGLVRHQIPLLGFDLVGGRLSVDLHVDGAVLAELLEVAAGAVEQPGVQRVVELPGDGAASDRLLDVGAQRVVEPALLDIDVHFEPAALPHRGGEAEDLAAPDAERPELGVGAVAIVIKGVRLPDGLEAFFDLLLADEPVPGSRLRDRVHLGWHSSILPWTSTLGHVLKLARHTDECSYLTTS